MIGRQADAKARDPMQHVSIRLSGIIPHEQEVSAGISAVPEGLRGSGHDRFFDEMPDVTGALPNICRLGPYPLSATLRAREEVSGEIVGDIATERVCGGIRSGQRCVVTLLTD